MGIESTLTVALIVDGDLWGMFACHHMSPHLVQSETRIAAELFGQLMSLMIKQRLEADEAAARVRTAAARQKIIVETDAASDLLHGFPHLSDVMRGLIQSDGLAVLREDKLQTDGSVPTPDAIRAIAKQLTWDDYLIEATDHLSSSGWNEGHGLNDSAGCLIVRATAAYPLEIMFFRDEKTKRVTWAGNPEKEYDVGPWGSRITPRGSFEAYLEEQSGRSDPWHHTDLASAREIQAMLTQITAKEERARLSRHQELVGHRRQQDLMIAELNHRVKNILALIRSLSRQAKASTKSIESYALALEQRVAALAAAHDLAVADSMSGVSLETLLKTELGPYTNDAKAQVLTSGPAVGLRADVAPLVALVFHEIVSNAAKYGALSTENGVVQVRWSLDDNGLDLSWRELGGPPVAAPDRQGFGRSLIERAIPYELDGRAALVFAPTGVTFDFHLPTGALTEISDWADPDAGDQIAGSLGEFKKAASGLRVLVVEDNLVLAMDMVDTVSRLGADDISSAATLESAAKELAAGPVDLAVLDMNIRGTVILDFAEELVERGIPFVFVTGYGSKIDVPQALAHVPILTKPVSDTLLAKGISQVMADAGG